MHSRSGPGARAAVLDRTLDLEAPRSNVQGEVDLVAAAHLLHTTDAAGEIVLAVLGPLGASARAALAHVADDAQAWAVVRADTPGHVVEADDTVRALRRAGWRACRVDARRTDRRLLAPPAGVGHMIGRLHPIPRGPRSALGTGAGRARHVLRACSRCRT